MRRWCHAILLTALTLLAWPVRASIPRHDRPASAAASCPLRTLIETAAEPANPNPQECPKDPFGETLVATGSAAGDNPFRFSTKYADDETGLVYYGRRYYSPALGRFVNRDPIQENGGVNQFAVCANNIPNKNDPFGLTNDVGDYGDWYPIIGPPRFQPSTNVWSDLERQLITELVAKCPTLDVPRKVIGVWMCCRPEKCKADAIDLAKQYIAALKFAVSKRVVPDGGMPGNIALRLIGGADYDGIDYPQELTPGLMCGGWVNMATSTIGLLVLPPARNACWTLEPKSRNSWITPDAHTWVELVSVHGGVVLDPWPSGGRAYR